MDSTVIAGSEQNSSTIVRKIAAPVGVTVSQRTCAGTVGIPRSNSKAAGAGSGRRPCSVSTLPSPSATGEAVTRSIPRRARPIAAPVTSTIASTAPTSWKCTCSSGTPWHLLERHPVHLGLRATQRLEDRERSLAHNGVELRALENLGDFEVGSTAVAVVCARLLRASALGDANLEIASRKRAALHVFHPQRMLELQTREICDELAPRQASVEQRSQKHIPGNPREQIQMQHAPTRALHLFSPDRHAGILARTYLGWLDLGSTSRGPVNRVGEAGTLLNS